MKTRLQTSGWYCFDTWRRSQDVPHKYNQNIDYK